MTDLALTYDSQRLVFDLADPGADLTPDDGLETAVIDSLFTDRLAEPDDELPDGDTDRRGWWGDMLAETPGDRIGSRLWLLSREKELPEVLGRAEEYANEALAWLVDDGVANSVEVTAENPSPGLMTLQITITRGDGRLWQRVWEAQI